MNQGIEKIGDLLQPAEEEITRLRAELEAVYRQQEKKSERIQLLIRPSLKADLEAQADKEGISRNEMINQLIEEALEALCEVFIMVGVGIDRSSSGCGLFGDDYQHRD